MRLINTTTLKLESFPDERDLRYAILSHRWEQDEVLYENMTSGFDLAELREMKGFAKIEQCCRQAKTEELEYVWVDTCCINKDSSAELQEAINSMFRWYSDAVTCYAYLSDVTGANTTGKDFRKSRWFTRGWTLQELIAPTGVIFFNQSWKSIGSRAADASRISQITGIQESILTYGFPKEERPMIAEIMSWTRGRETTRVEDQAYSLLGLFDINMPLLYGEGHKAFKRLQEEIIRNTADQTIFAWGGIESGNYSLLAKSPDRFPVMDFESDASPTFFATWCIHRGRRKPQMVTNQGISLTMDLVPWRPPIYLAIVGHHKRVNALSNVSIGIFLRPIDSLGHYARVSYLGRDFVNHRVWYAIQEQNVTVVNSLTKSEKEIVERDPPFYGYKISYKSRRPRIPQDFSVQAQGHGIWSEDQSTLGMKDGCSGPMAVIHFSPEQWGHGTTFKIMLGFYDHFTPYFSFSTLDDDTLLDSFVDAVDLTKKPPSHSPGKWMNLDDQSLHNGVIRVSRRSPYIESDCDCSLDGDFVVVRARTEGDLWRRRRMSFRVEAGSELHPPSCDIVVDLKDALQGNSYWTFSIQR